MLLPALTNFRSHCLHWVGSVYDGFPLIVWEKDAGVNAQSNPSVTLDVLVDTSYSDKDLEFVRNLLFMAAAQSLYAVYVETRAAHIC